jgi:hypothetical protein
VTAASVFVSICVVSGVLSRVFDKRRIPFRSTISEIKEKITRPTLLVNVLGTISIVSAVLGTWALFKGW